MLLGAQLSFNKDIEVQYKNLLKDFGYDINQDLFNKKLDIHIVKNLIP